MNLNQIKQTFRKSRIDKVKIGGFDVDGILRGKYISSNKFFSVAESGLGFCDVIFGWDCADALYDRPSVTGWHTGYPDATARIDLSTFRILPWEPNTAFFLLDFFRSDRKPLAVSPRQVLRRIVEHAESMGYSPRAAIEYEYWLFREDPHSAREKRFLNLAPMTPGMFGYSLLRASVHSDLAHAILDAAHALNIEIEGHHTETGPGVYETAIRVDDALRAADKAALFKTAVKVVAQKRGLMATFMAKWNAALPGSSGHIHQSLMDLRARRNLFYGGSDRALSPLMGHYLGGQLALMPEFAVMFLPSINSYKRTAPGTKSWAPVNATWGVDNRTTALRALLTGPKTTRVEHRLPGADANPYLALAASLASGLYGVEQRLKPPKAAANAYDSEDAAPLPRTLKEANDLFIKSRAARDWFGGEFVDFYSLTRDWEVRQFERAVTDWELERYFESI
ncbi:MAG TPA: glutamine synthetase family protein [Terriglobia bacterium]|nr:glutamine synthetase family protein [Terriglobia bacterium]